MKRFTLKVVVMFIMIVGVMVEQIWGQEDFNTYYNRGIENYKKDNCREAVSDLSKAIQINPNSAEAYYYRACAYTRFINHNLDAPDYVSSVSDLSKAIQINPRYIEAYMKRGELRDTYKVVMDLDKAFADYSMVISIDPNCVEAYHCRGYIWQKRGDLDKAMADYNKAIQIDPKCSPAYYGRGIIYEKNGDLDKAIVEYQRAADVASNNIEYYVAKKAFDDLYRKQSQKQLRGY